MLTIPPTEPGWHCQRIPKDDGTVEEVWTFHGVEDPLGEILATIREAGPAGDLIERSVTVRGIHPPEAFQ